MEQVCKKCQNTKPLIEFNETSNRSVITHITTCKFCQSDYNAINYALNKERILNNQRYRRNQQKKHDKQRYINQKINR